MISPTTRATFPHKTSLEPTSNLPGRNLAALHGSLCGGTFRRVAFSLETAMLGGDANVCWNVLTTFQIRKIKFQGSIDCQRKLQVTPRSDRVSYLIWQINSAPRNLPKALPRTSCNLPGTHPTVAPPLRHHDGIKRNRIPTLKFFFSDLLQKVWSLHSLVALWPIRRAANYTLQPCG